MSLKYTEQQRKNNFENQATRFSNFKAGLAERLLKLSLLARWQLSLTQNAGPKARCCLLSYESHVRITFSYSHLHDTTNASSWHDKLIFMTRQTHLHGTPNPSSSWHDKFIFITRQTNLHDMKNSSSRHDKLIFMTRQTHLQDTTN